MGTNSYNSLFQDNKKLKQCTQWFIRRGILQQFNFAREMEQGGDLEITPENRWIIEPIAA
jgi:hypothetical protein